MNVQPDHIELDTGVPRVKNTGGRPTKLTDDVQKQIIQVIEMGNYIETAAAYAGVSKDALYKWLRKGREAKKGKYYGFVNAIEKALAESEVRDVLNVTSAASVSWQASAWRLERKFPDRWGRRDVIQHTGPEGGAIQIETRSSIMDKVAKNEEVRQEFLNLARKLDIATDEPQEEP